MIIFTSEQRDQLLQLQQGRSLIIDPVPVADSNNYAINEAFLSDSEYSYLHEFLSQLPTADVILQRSRVTLEQAKTEKIRLINHECERQLNSLVSDYPASERDTWEQKIKEAENLLDHGVPATYLSIEATQRGVNVEVLAQKVLQKADEYLTAAATITGNRGKHTDTVNSLTSVDDVLAYDFLS